MTSVDFCTKNAAAKPPVTDLSSGVEPSAVIQCPTKLFATYETDGEDHMKGLAFALAIVLVFGSITVWAQGTSQIQGVVKDTTGAVIGGVEVKATQIDTGITRTVTSTEDGVYVLPNILVGPYKLEVSKSGFSTYVQAGIVLQVNTFQTIDIVLKVGEIAQQVQVEANSSLVELQTTSVGVVIENQRIL
jgi:hypothetical protein